MEGILDDFQRLNRLFRPSIYSLIGLISTTVLLWHNFDFMTDQVQSSFNRLNGESETFDFIVVGAGTSGSVVATRLARHYRVLLLEAGGSPNPLSSMPGMALLMINQPHIDWQFTTVPQRNACIAMNGQRCYWPRGKGLGGTSNLNFLMYARGHPSDFSQWANITGDRRWSYEELLPYFKKSESWAHSDSRDAKYHGTNGPIRIGFPPYMGMAKEFLEAAIEHNFPIIDFNAPFREGFSAIPYTQQDNGRRFGTYQAFILPQANNRNLTIYKYAEVLQILFRDTTAYGVQFSRHGNLGVAFASKEIIVSAGAIGSPKLLMLSGIGRTRHLEQHNIAPIVDLPTGENLQDHVSAFVGPFIVNKSITMNLDRDVTPASLFEFLQSGKGPMSSTGVQASSFLISSLAKQSGQGDWPDFQWILLGTAIYEKLPKDFEFAFNVRSGILQEYYKSAKEQDSFEIITLLSRPKGRGEILLASSNPFDKPLIDPHYLEDPSDVKVLIEAIKRAVSFVENSAVFRKMGGKLMETPFPGCENVAYRTDAYWECFIRQYTLPMYHPCCTCPMGKRNSREAVVDSQLRVIGVTNLRVVDASIMPTIVTSNTNAACLAIGEFGAQLLHERWHREI